MKAVAHSEHARSGNVYEVRARAGGSFPCRPCAAYRMRAEHAFEHALCWSLMGAKLRVQPTAGH